MQALLNSHVEAAEHSFIDEWQRGPAPPQIDDVGVDTVTIFWNPVPGASHYELQRKKVGGGGDGGVEQDSSTTSSSWTTLTTALSGTVVKKRRLEPSTTYLFRYRAHDNRGGCESPFSSPSDGVTTLFIDVVRPTPPKLIQRDSTSLTVGWESNGDLFDLQLRACSSSVPLPWTHVATVSSRAVKKKGLTPKTKYEFRVRSSSSSSSPWSAPSSVLTTSPSFNPFKQLLGGTLINQQSKVLSIDDALQQKKIVMLYFSASWCPPCKQFTPMLAKFYNEMKAAKRSLEIVFVSADRDVGSFQEYLKHEHPWTAIPYDSPSRTQASGYFQVNGIPRLIVFNGSTGAIVCSNAVGQPLNSTSLDQWEKM
jgi:thiol-disulfide isomerase/thioredoxin